MGRFERVAVLGYGTMGRGIAQVIAASGREVVVLEPDRSRIESGEASVAAFLSESVRRGKLADSERGEILNRIHGTTDINTVANSGLVVEAIVEDRDAKATLWKQVAKVVGDDAVLVSNTSALSITDLAAEVPSPERFAGLHFFNPVPLMPLIEVVVALQSATTTIRDLEDFCVSLGKSAVVVADRPGFLVNRLLIPYLNDVIQAYDDGLASAEDIDVALELGLGYRMGPLRMLDMIGLDVHRHATANAYEQLRDGRFAPPPLLERMVAAGYLGDKTGRGFRIGDGQLEDTKGAHHENL